MMNSNMDHGYVLSIMYTIRVYNDSLGSETGDTNSTTFEEEPFNMEMVWSANQDIPVSANSTFSIDEEGYMALIDPIRLMCGLLLLKMELMLVIVVVLY